MDKDVFINVLWDYYLSLENDFKSSIRYVSIVRSNYKTSSIEYAKLLLSICSEIEVILKKICDFNGKDRKNINDYLKVIKGKNLLNKDNCITMKRPHANHNFKPFDKWQEGGKLSWWLDYNDVKHNRDENIVKANLKNVLLSLSALYLLENYLYLQVIKNKPNEIDFIDPHSSLFTLSWETKMKAMDNVYMELVTDIAGINDSD